MAQSTSTYILSYIFQNVPSTILELAFRPREFQTSLEQRIISEIVEGPVLLDTNLVGGKRREIYLQACWRMQLQEVNNESFLGNGVEATYYKVPPEAREHRNISSVVGITSASQAMVAGTGVDYNGAGSFGNTATGMLSQMMNTRTFAQYPIQPLVTLEGTNIICFKPSLMMDGCAVSVFLEYDSEFLNMNTSGIMAMRNLCLCAVQRYVATKLRVQVDQTEVVAGMEIGVIKQIIDEYYEAGKQYNELLTKLRGALAYDPKSMSRMIYLGL